MHNLPVSRRKCRHCERATRSSVPPTLQDMSMPEQRNVAPDSAPPSVDDVVAAVDVERLTGDQLGRVCCKEGDSRADIVDRDRAAGWSLRLGLLQERLELGNP